MPRHCTRFWTVLAGPCWLAALLTLLSVSNARAYDGQASADLALGYMHVAPDGLLPAPGASLSLGASYGLGDMFVLRANAGYGLQADGEQRVSVASARIEVAYLLDVLSVVPFFGGGATAWLFKVDEFTVAPGGHVLLGVDWLITREWTTGLDVRIGMIAVDKEVFGTTEAQLRVSRTFDLL